MTQNVSLTHRIPTVSVLVPTFNRRQLLSRALQSLEKQTFRDFEIVIINDGGVPVNDVVESLTLSVDAQIVNLPTNSGRCGALNAGLDRARGRLIAFLDDDDIYYPHHLQTLAAELNVLGSNHAVYSYAIKALEDNEGVVTERAVVGATEFDENVLQVANFIVGMTVLAPAASIREIGGLDQNLRVLEDWDLWLRLSRAIRFNHLSIPTAEYRWRQGRGNQTVREWFRFHDALEKIYAKNPLPDGSPLAAEREAMRANSFSRREAYSYELSIVLICEGDMTAALRSLQSYATAFGRLDSVELIILVPDIASWSPLIASLDGDVQAYGIDTTAGSSAVDFAVMRAGGRRIGYLFAGEVVDPQLVDQVLRTQPGRPQPIGRQAQITVRPSDLQLEA